MLNMSCGQCYTCKYHCDYDCKTDNCTNCNNGVCNCNKESEDCKTCKYYKEGKGTATFENVISTYIAQQKSLCNKCKGNLDFCEQYNDHMCCLSADAIKGMLEQ